MHWEQRGEGSSGLNLNLFQSKDSNGEAARKKLGREFKTCRAMLQAIGNVYLDFPFTVSITGTNS